MVARKCKEQTCGKLFQARAADVARGWGLFCSKRCKAIAQERRTGQNAAYLERRDSDLDDDNWGHIHASGIEGHSQS